MESEDQLYLSLPSSASMDLHPDNVISDYTTELLSPVYLERGMYEIGLSEIILDADVENITETRLAFTIFRSEECVKNVLKIPHLGHVKRTQISKRKYFYERIFITRGLYRSLTEMFRHFNTKLKTSKICKDLIFQNNKIDSEGNVLITFKSIEDVDLKDSEAFIWQREDWFRKCPYIQASTMFHETAPSMVLSEGEQEAIKTDKSLHFVCNPWEMFDDVGMAYIYTDVVDYQHVGNTKAPLLRIVHFPRDKRVINFPHIQYLPICRTSINSLRIYIRTIEGKVYPFAKGSAMCKVHIRKKIR